MADKTVPRICEQCRVPFGALVSNVKAGKGRFCSQTCWRESRKRQTLRPCQQCHEPFQAFDAEIRRGKGRFCSRKCSSVFIASPAQFVERFWAKVDTSGDCWIWKAGVSKYGYGAVGKRRWSSTAHRVAYEIANGEIPKGMLVRHKCDNPPCVNPAHLELGTHADNTHDMVVRGRTNNQRGEKAHGAKLTNAQAQEMRARYRTQSGPSQATLAAEYGVSSHCVFRVLHNRTYKHCD